MRNLVLREKHNHLLIRDPAEATKLALEINDVIITTKIFNPTSLEIFLKTFTFLLPFHMIEPCELHLVVRNYIQLKAPRNIQRPYTISGINLNPLQTRVGN